MTPWPPVLIIKVLGTMRRMMMPRACACSSAEGDAYRHVALEHQVEGLIKRALGGQRDEAVESKLRLERLERVVQQSDGRRVRARRHVRIGDGGHTRERRTTVGCVHGREM